MSDPTNNTSTLTLDTGKARALLNESNPAYLQVLGALVAASLLIRSIDWGAMSETSRAEYLELYFCLNDNIRDALFEVAP